MPTYYVYLVRCSDSTFYAGITTNVLRRVAEHNGTSKGAKYTRSRQPVVLVYQEEYMSRSEALKREHSLRKLSHSEKKQLIPYLNPAKGVG